MADMEKINFSLGAYVRISKQTREERLYLNGQEGQVCSFEESGRVDVQLNSDQSLVKVQVKNLTWVDSNEECFHKFDRHHIEVTKYVEEVFPFPFGAVVLINAISFLFHNAFASICSSLNPDGNTVTVEIFPLSGYCIAVEVSSLSLAPENIAKDLASFKCKDLNDCSDDYDNELEQLEEEQNDSDNNTDVCLDFMLPPLPLKPQSKFSLMTESEKLSVLCKPANVSTSRLSASATPFVMRNQTECYGTYSEFTNIDSWADCEENSIPNYN